LVLLSAEVAQLATSEAPQRRERREQQVWPEKRASVVWLAQAEPLLCLQQEVSVGQKRLPLPVSADRQAVWELASFPRDR
jgi:hypothetical protein